MLEGKVVLITGASEGLKASYAHLWPLWRYGYPWEYTRFRAGRRSWDCGLRVDLRES